MALLLDKGGPRQKIGGGFYFGSAEGLGFELVGGQATWVPHPLAEC